MRHINDQTLDQLLEDSLGDQDERELEMHIQQCHTCAARLREWEVLFPQIRGVAPAVEGQLEEALAASPVRSSVVILPDWTPPPEAPQAPRTRPSKLWAVVGVLAIAAAWLGFRNTDVTNDEPTLVANEPPPQPSTDTQVGALGSGVGLTPSAFAESAAANAVQKDAGAPVVDSVDERDSLPATEEAPPPRDDPPAAPETRVAVDEENRPAITSREEPVRFPIKSPEKTPPATQPAPEVARPTNTGGGTPLPVAFTRVSLGEAISRLGGPVRLIEGMTPEVVEVAAGTALPGADPDHAVVRLIYNSPTGRIILDQQRLNRRGPQEPDIAINTAASGVSVAQWVDWKGYWISLASRTNQESLLAIANRIRESP